MLTRRHSRHVGHADRLNWTVTLSRRAITQLPAVHAPSPDRTIRLQGSTVAVLGRDRTVAHGTEEGDLCERHLRRIRCPTRTHYDHIGVGIRRPIEVRGGLAVRTSR